MIFTTVCVNLWESKNCGYKNEEKYYSNYAKHDWKKTDNNILKILE